MGMASFLANSGSGGAAEYIPSDVIAAGYTSTREPKQMFEEMLALTTRSRSIGSKPPRPGRIGVGSQSLPTISPHPSGQNRPSAWKTYRPKDPSG